MRILIADDEVVSRKTLEKLLIKWGYDVTCVENGDAAWKQLELPDAPRIVLLDWMMPGQNGIDICRRMRLEHPEPYTYILLLSAKDGKEQIVEGLESGADDYLTKPFHPQELKARLRVGLRLLELEDNLVQARESMRFKAMHDVLTGVWNRGAILETLEREMSRAQRAGQSLGVLMGDIDHFKSVNDTYGHLTGDAVLCEITSRIQRSIRAYDSIGRYGGEEFLILLPDCDVPATEDKAEQIRNAVAQKALETSQGPVRITISVGGIASAGYREASATQLIRLADAALYHAKVSGRNRVVMASAADYEEIRHPSMASASKMDK